MSLSFGCSANLHHGNAARQLAQAFVELFAVEVRIGTLKFGANLLAALFDSGLVAIAVDNHGGVLRHLDGLGMTQHVKSGVGQAQAEVLHNGLTLGDNGNVFQDAQTAIAETRSLDGSAGKGAAQAVEQQGGKGFAFDVFCNDEQRAARLADLLKQGQDILDRSKPSGR